MSLSHQPGTASATRGSGRCQLWIRSAVALVLLLSLLGRAYSQEAAERTASYQQGAAAATTSQSFSVSGKVVNAVTGDPIPRAKVSFDGEQMQATLTNGDGEFRFDRVSAA